MHTGNVVSFRKPTPEIPRVECTVEIAFYEGRLNYRVSGVEESLKDRRAVAAALEAVATELWREG